MHITKSLDVASEASRSTCDGAGSTLLDNNHLVREPILRRNRRLMRSYSITFRTRMPARLDRKKFATAPRRFVPISEENERLFRSFVRTVDTTRDRRFFFFFFSF